VNRLGGAGEGLGAPRCRYDSVRHWPAWVAMGTVRFRWLNRRADQSARLSSRFRRKGPTRFVIEPFQLRDTPVYVCVEVVATAEFFQDCPPSSSLFGIESSKCGLQLLQDLGCWSWLRAARVDTSSMRSVR